MIRWALVTAILISYFAFAPTVLAADPLEAGCGELNRDGTVNVLDLIVVFKIIASGSESTTEIILSADLNRDGLLDVLDVISGLRAIVDHADFRCGFTHANSKDSGRFSSREAFIVSDADWPTVLGLVSLTTWSSDGGGIYPTLVYHREGESFDADSLLHFLEQYGPDRVTMVGANPPALVDLVASRTSLVPNQIESADFPGYWREIDEVVLVEDDYGSALIASTYAALINAPLIIRGDELDRPETLADRHVICVGLARSECAIVYEQDELRRVYLAHTHTDKVVLVNSNDLTIAVSERLTPENPTGTLNSLFGRTSLVAPFLAAAKQQLLINTLNSDSPSVDALIEDELSALGITDGYLTIVGSPDAIAMYASSPSVNNFEADFIMYADLDDDEERQSELAVGRIFGITVTDASTMVARSLFYDDIRPDETGLVMIPKGDPLRQSVSVNESGTGFCESYFGVPCDDLFAYKELFDTSDACDETKYQYEHMLFSHSFDSGNLQQIVDDTSSKTWLEASGEQAIWLVGRDIYVADLDTDTTRIVHSGNTKPMAPTVSARRAAWVEGGFVHVLDLGTGESVKLGDGRRDVKELVLDGDWIAMLEIESTFNGPDLTLTYSIHVTNLSTGESRLVTYSESAMGSLDISGATLVWLGEGNSVNHFNLDTGQGAELDSGAWALAVDESIVVWYASDSIKRHDLSIGTTDVVESGVGWTNVVDVSGDRISWLGTSGYEVFVHNLLEGSTETVATTGNWTGQLALSSSHVIWVAAGQSYLEIGDSAYDVECLDRKVELLEQLYRSTFAFYGGHGGHDNWVDIVRTSDLNALPPMAVYAFGCSTCQYTGTRLRDMLCMNMIRKGAVAYIGDTGPTYGNHFVDDFLEEALAKGSSLGEAFRVGKNKERIGDWETPSSIPSAWYGAFTVLIGDPTFDSGLLVSQ